MNDVYSGVLSFVSAGELAVRMSTYDTLVKHYTKKYKKNPPVSGMTDAQILTKAKRDAAYETSNVLNYGARGNVSTFADAISPFFGATIQAIRAHANKGFTLRNQPAEYWASVTQVIAGQTILALYILSQSEDDEKNGIVPLSDSDSYILNNIIIPLGVSDNLKGNKAREFISLPIDKTNQMYMLAGRAIAELIYYSGRSDEGKKRVGARDFVKLFSETLPGVGSMPPLLSLVAALTQ